MKTTLKPLSTPDPTPTGQNRKSAAQVQAVCSLLRTCRFHHDSEDQLQLGLFEVLREHGFEVEREVTRGGDRFDLVLGSLVIEVKTGGPLASVTRQLHRYAQLDCVEALLLVTTRAQHRRLHGAVLGGKTVRVHYLSPL